MPPFGGKAAYLGTNPISVAAPAGRNPPFVFDMATSQVARGKIINAAREGKPIPEGWAVTRDGLPTTDAQAAMGGFVLPMGGAKGSALSFLAEVLSGILTGGPFGPGLARMYEEIDRPQQVAHFFWAFRPDLFMDLDQFKGRMDQILAEVRAVPPAPGFAAVLAPGDVERANEERNRNSGIPITPGLCREFGELATEYGVPLPAELAEIKTL
jgi:LDH2 family malate/lactate/ureidoglycolate dehydrogenase